MSDVIEKAVATVAQVRVPDLTLQDYVQSRLANFSKHAQVSQQAGEQE